MSINTLQRDLTAQTRGKANVGRVMRLGAGLLILGCTHFLAAATVSASGDPQTIQWALSQQ